MSELAPHAEEAPASPAPLARHVLLGAASLVMLYPLLWMLASSQARGGDLQLGLADPLARRVRRLCARLVRAARIPSASSSGTRCHRRDPRGDRQRVRLLARRLRLRAAALSGPELLVRTDAGHADAALPRDADPAIRAVPQPRLGQHVPAAGRAEVPRRRRLLHLPAWCSSSAAFRASSTRRR